MTSDLRQSLSFLGAALLLVGCSANPASPSPVNHPPANQAECLANARFGAPEASPYILPWAEGLTFTVGQSYCSGSGWSHENRYAYDFLMPIGTEIRNVRAGVVVELREGFPDGNRNGGQENMLSLRHSDETISIYMHLRYNGVAVNMGEYVPQGGLLGYSGDTGDTRGIPHLHFQICVRSGMCSYKTQEITLPVNFRNAEGVYTSAGGLAQGESYTAGPWS